MFSFGRIVKPASLLTALLMVTAATATYAADATATAAAAPKAAPAQAAQAAPAPGKKGASRAASQDRMKIYNDALKAAKNKNIATLQQAQKLREQLVGIITADKFDKQAYIAKNTEIENLNTQMRANITQAAAAALAQYTAEERKAMAGSLTHERGEKHGASRAASKGGEKGKDKGSKGASKSGKDKAASKTTKKASKADPKNAKGGK